MTTQDIKNVQSMLNSLGDDLEVDGQLGPKTKEAVKQFQLSHNLLPTGLIDSETSKKISEATSAVTSEDSESFFQKYQNQIIVGSVIFFVGGIWLLKEKVFKKERQDQVGGRKFV